MSDDLLVRKGSITQCEGYLKILCKSSMCKVRTWSYFVDVRGWDICNFISDVLNKHRFLFSTFVNRDVITMIKYLCQYIKGSLTLVIVEIVCSDVFHVVVKYGFADEPISRTRHEMITKRKNSDVTSSWETSYDDRTYRIIWMFLVQGTGICTLTIQDNSWLGHHWYLSGYNELLNSLKTFVEKIRKMMRARRIKIFWVWSRHKFRFISTSPMHTDATEEIFPFWNFLS